MSRIVGMAAVATILMAPPPAGAQSAQPWSLQGSVLLANVDLGGELVGGAGIEAQLRFTPAALWSAGIGIQSTTHKSGGEQLSLSGFFIEPRYALDIGSDRFAPYLAGRIAVLNQDSDLANAPNAKSSGFAVGGGGGLLIRATPKMNVDLGVAFVNQSFSDATASNGSVVKFDAFFGYVAKAGVSIGF